MKLKVLLAALLVSSPAFSATLISKATGNIDSTATWSVVDTSGTNAYLNSETANTALTTSGVASSTFTPAAETLTAIGVKLASVATSPSGTITIKLANSTSPGTRECTQTVNVSDLTAVNSAPTAATADGGWVILSCSASPNGTDAYTITANTSVGSQVNLFSLATTNWSRLLVTNATQTNGPAAGDKFIVSGVLTGAGTHSAFVVTIETTSLVNYGNVANTLVDPSISVTQFGTLQFASSASTAYVSEFAGPMVVYNGGVFTVGTSGTPIPSTSSATLTLNSSVEGDTGVNVRNGGTFNSAGSAGGRTVTKTLLTATANASATSLTVADSTGWVSGDSIVIAGTQITSGTDASSKWDAVSLTGNASGTTLTTGALTNQHTANVISYTSSSTGSTYSMNMYAAVILLNRNVIIQGSSSTTNGYVYFQANSIGAITWTEFSLMSGLVAGQRGLEVDVGPLGTFSVTNSSFINAHNTCLMLAPVNTNFGGTSGNTLLVQHNVMYNCASNASPSTAMYGVTVLAVTFNPWWKIDDFTIIRTGYANGNGGPFKLFSVIGQVSNITLSGSAAGGSFAFWVAPNYSSAGIINPSNPWGPITLYANVGAAFNVTAANFNGTISGMYVWHEQARFIPEGNITFDPLYLIDVPFGIYNVLAGSTIQARNGIIGYTTASSGGTAPVQIDSQTVQILLDNMELCPIGSPGSTTVTFTVCTSNQNVISLESDVTWGGGTTPSGAQVYLRNTSLLNSTPAASWPTMRGQESYYDKEAFIVQDCASCTVKHGAWLPVGYISYDTAITHSSGFSLRMTPKVLGFTGYIAGTTINVPAGWPANVQIGDSLFSNGAGYIQTLMTGLINSTSATVSVPQTTGSSGSQVQFQTYRFNGTNRMQSAPYTMGIKFGVASGTSNAQACVWLRPSINTDAGPVWGGSAVTYNGDAPRMIVRQNPAMGVQSDTVLATSSPTAGTWAQLCGTLPTAPNDGEYEVVIDADQTFTSNAGGSVNVAEWSCTNCSSANNTQYWWNGTPTMVVAPASGGGSSGPGALITN